MIDVRTEKGNTEIKVIHGTVTELITDCTIIIRIIYRTMKKKNPKCAAAFKDVLQSGFFAERVLDESIYSTQEPDKEITEGLFALQKLMTETAKGGDHVAD